MKTIYSIGRDSGCDIYLYDDRNVISRTHAILKVGKRGKYFISDQSMNGTYVNGIKIAQGAQVPVTRKDVISFAHVAELDWEMIPKPFGGVWLFVLIFVVTLALAGGIAFGVKEYIDSRSVVPQMAMPVPEVSEEEEAKKKEAEKDAKFKEIEEQLRKEMQKKENAEAKKREKAEAEKKAKEEAEKAEKAKAAEEAAKDQGTMIY